MREQLSGVRSEPTPALMRSMSQPGRPRLLPGTIVWRGGETYVAELIERHGMEWMVGVVALGDARRSSARLRFIPVRELDWV